jgi:hypothetical protein
MHLRGLTFQEKKAAEAAFRGLPLEPQWSEKAKAIYEGIAKARGLSLPPEPHQPIVDVTRPVSSTPLPDEPAAVRDRPDVPQGATPATPVAGAGYFVDLTPLAREVGLSWPVIMSKPLWDVVMTGLPAGSPGERLRAVLGAVGQSVIGTPGVVTAIKLRMALAVSDEVAPQPFELLVVVHHHPYGQSVTLLRPDEPWLAVLPDPRNPEN